MKHTLILALSALTFAGGASRVQAVTYSVDGGSFGATLGDTDPNWSAAAINHFTAVAGGQNIVSISVLFGGTSLPPSGLTGGEAFTVAVWSDPDNNGNPSDAVLLGSASGNISVFNDNVTFQTTAIPTVSLAVGQSFFAGVYYQSYAANILPQAVSTSGGSPSESWIAYVQPGTLNLSAIGSSPVLGNLGTIVGTPGIVAMVRANGVPEPGAVALTGLAAAGLLRRRRA